MANSVIDTDAKLKLQAVVSEQLPEFVQSDHPTFVAFLEAYYEYLEQNGNAIEATRNIRLYNDIDRTVDEFVTYFKKNFLVDIPDNILNDKRTFLKCVKEFYKGKGTDKSFILLFRMLFNEEISIYYPKRDMLRVSDGKFTSDTILNLIDVEGPVVDIVGQQVTQANVVTEPDINLATAQIESFIAFTVVGTVYQLTLTQNSVAGTFVAGQRVTIETPNGTVYGTIDEIITGIDIANDGRYYNTGDPLITKNLTPKVTKEDASGYVLTESGDYIVTEEIGTSAQFDITSVGKGGVDGFLINNPGKGYALKDAIEFTETGLGTNSRAYVSRIEPALLLENGSDSLLSESGDKILLGDFGNVIKEDGDAILTEDGGYIVQEDKDYVGRIYDIHVVDAGINYTTLPVVEVDNTTGSGADIYALSNDIGRIIGVQRTNLGSGYFRPPTVLVMNNVILSNVQGTFYEGETVTSDPFRLVLENGDAIKLETDDYLNSEDDTVMTGTILEIDTNRSLYKIQPSTGYDSFAGAMRITGQTAGATANIYQSDPAVINPISGTVSRSEGVLFGADGRVSESSKKIQDSYYYQEFSYVVKVGQSINIWRDAVKRILHPIGLALFGEVSISTKVGARVYGGNASVKLNTTAPRYKQLTLAIETLLDLVPSTQASNLELDIFAEVAQATLFPTRIMQEDGTYILLEDSEEENSNKGKNYLRGEEYIIGTEPGSVYPKLIFPTHRTPVANIDATILFLKQVTLFLREGAAAFDNSANIPTSPNNTTSTGNQSGRTEQTPDITILLQTFEQYVNSLTANSSVQHTINIYNQLYGVARSVQNVVKLILPTITSTDTLEVLSTSKLHIILNSALQDAYLHESFGSAKLGTTGYSIERFKFLFPPYSAGARKIDRGGVIYRDAYTTNTMTANYTGSNTSNNTYWDTYANTQIANIGNLVVDDLVNYPGRKTNFTFDSEIFLRDS